MVAIMSLIDWFDPNFLYQLRFFYPHIVNGRWFFLKRDIVLPYNYPPIPEFRMNRLMNDPPAMAKPVTWFLKSTLFLRMSQANVDLAWKRMTPRGMPISDWIGPERRKIRTAILVKSRDPYLHMQIGARGLRQRFFRAFGWSVPPRHGPGEGMGTVPRRLDQQNKLARMIDDDYCDTAIGVFFLRMFPVVCMRKYINELPRPTPYWYGMDYTREQMFMHIAWGIDPSVEAVEDEEENLDPAIAEQRSAEEEYAQYLLPELYIQNKPDYKLKWPFPDDNIYRPTYERGFTREFWCRHPY